MKKTYLLLGVSGVAFLGLTGACGDSEGDAASSTGTSSTPTCEPTNQACPALAVQSDCLAITDNSGADRFSLRLAQLTVEAPTALTSDIVAGIISDGVNINLPACNIGGMGTFSMLTDFDKTSGTMTIGGAFPEANPTDGYCFIDDPPNNVGPVEVALTLNEDGTFESAVIPALTVPIYADAAGSSIVYLPLRDGQITGGQLSPDQNCVGRFNGDLLSPEDNCAPVAGGPDYYTDGASLEGYITLEDADAVDVDLLQASLCVLLSPSSSEFGDGGTPVNRCRRDMNGAIILEGDWCSTSNMAEDCKDSFRLQARFAASAATIRDNCP